MEVSSVTLWMFGGVTRIEGEAQTPRTQFWIAFSGPLTSLLLSAIQLQNRVQRVLSAT
jgi:Zn-dependent protease